jgi:hypothetical protein
MTESVKSDLNAFSAEDDDQLVIGLRKSASPSLWAKSARPYYGRGRGFTRADDV